MWFLEGGGGFQWTLIITSNLEFSQWNTVFGDNRLTAALVDRLIHHSHIIIFSGESYRLTQSMNRRRTKRGCNGYGKQDKI